MKRCLLLCALLLLVLSIPAHAVSQRIALSDFAVHSDNPRYKYMGKGISEMIAVELAKSADVNLVEREKRAEMLEEIEFALSDLGDTTKQVEVGRMLAAQYMIFGEIVDMDPVVLISLRMVEVETGRIVWVDQLVCRISSYDYITGYFTASILKLLRLSVPRSTVAKAESAVEKSEEAVVAFSRGLDAYDRGEKTEAEKELTTARRLDPTNEAVRLYLSKLLVNLSKFRIEAAAMQLPSQNPAYLGLLQYAQVFAMLNINDVWKKGLYVNGVWKDEIYSYLPDYGLGYRRDAGHIIVGCSLPLGRNVGLQTNFFTWVHQESVARPELFDPDNPDPNWGANDYRLVQDYGAQVGVGWAVTDWLSIGLSTSVFLEYARLETPDGVYIATATGVTPLENPDEIVIPADAGLVMSAFELGIVLKNGDSSVVLDLLSGYSLGRQYLLHPVEYMENLDYGTPYTVGDWAALPLVLEGTLTFALLDRRLFLMARQSNEISFDQAAYTGRISVGAEVWFAQRLGLRAPLEVSLHTVGDDWTYGWGGGLGVTFRSIRYAWDLDLGVNYRMEPIRAIPGQFVYQPIFYVSVAKNFPPGLGQRRTRTWPTRAR